MNDICSCLALQNPQAILADLASMLLSNLSAATSVCTALLSLKVPILPDDRSPMKWFPVDSRCGTCPAPVPYPSGEPKEVLALPLLIDAFVKAAPGVENQDLTKRTHKGELHFLSSVFANLSTVGPSPNVSPCTFSDRTTGSCGSHVLFDAQIVRSVWRRCRHGVPSIQTPCLYGAQRHDQARRRCIHDQVR